MRVADGERTCSSRATQALALGPGGTVLMRGTLEAVLRGMPLRRDLPADRFPTTTPLRGGQSGVPSREPALEREKGRERNDPRGTRSARLHEAVPALGDGKSINGGKDPQAKIQEFRRLPEQPRSQEQNSSKRNDDVSPLLPEIQMPDPCHDRERGRPHTVPGFLAVVHLFGVRGDREEQPETPSPSFPPLSCHASPLAPQVLRTVRTSFTCPSTFTLRKIAFMIPSGPITNVLRSIPQYFFPYMFFFA